MSIAHVSHWQVIHLRMSYINEGSVKLLHIMLLEGTEHLVEDLGAHSRDTSRAEYNCWFLVSHVDNAFLDFQLIKFEEGNDCRQGDTLDLYRCWRYVPRGRTALRDQSMT